MILTFLGTGTSYGVPYIGCDCAVCTSEDPCNKRTRSSILVENATTRVLVDSTPDLRAQLLREGIGSVSAIAWTHHHNDHVIGLDDVRPLSDRGGYIDGYANQATSAHLHRVFPYVFKTGRRHGGLPRVRLQTIEGGESFEAGDVRITAVPIMHGRFEILAYRFDCDGRSLVYATDCSAIPESSVPIMCGVDVLVLDALRHAQHPTHFSLAQAREASESLAPGRTFFTHIAHDLDHETTNATLPQGMQLAYDGLKIEV